MVLSFIALPRECLNYMWNDLRSWFEFSKWSSANYLSEILRQTRFSENYVQKCDHYFFDRSDPKD